MLTITHIPMYPFDSDIQVYEYSKISFEPGLTLLCGCNGYGKTTLLNIINDKLSHDDVYADYHIIQFFENGLEGHTFKKEMLQKGLWRVLADDIVGSEGESRFNRLGIICQQIGDAIRCNYKNVVVLVDGIDSGLSIDMLQAITAGLKFVVDDAINESNTNLYILMSNNQYELTIDNKCIDVRTGDILSFDSYDDFKDYILNCKELKRLGS